MSGALLNMSHVQVAILCDEGASSSTLFVIFFKEQRKKNEDTEG